MATMKVAAARARIRTASHSRFACPVRIAFRTPSTDRRPLVFCPVTKILGRIGGFLSMAAVRARRPHGCLLGGRLPSDQLRTVLDTFFSRTASCPGNRTECSVWSSPQIAPPT